MAGIRHGVWAALLLFVVGCPWLQNSDVRFTSADVDSGNFRTFDGAAPFDGEPMEEDEGGGDAAREIGVSATVLYRARAVAGPT